MGVITAYLTLISMQRLQLKADGFQGIRCVLQTNKKRLMVHVCAFLILCLALPSVAGATRRSAKKKASHKKQHLTTESFLAREMLKHIGLQYRKGGSSSEGVDCSGYVRLVYQNIYGVTLPRQSSSLYSSSDLQEVSLDGLKTGDLLFFTSSATSKRIDHVGIYLWSGSFIHASIRKGVIVSSLEMPYYSDRFAGARRVPKQWDSLLPWDETDSGRSSYDATKVPEASASTASAKGIGLVKDIKPFPWLIMTPSLSYFQYDRKMDERGLPRHSIGVDLSFAVKDKWIVSTGFHHLSLSSDTAYAKQESTPTGIDMSLSYSRRLSGGSSVSLIGEQQQYEPPANLLQRQGSFKDQRVSINFNLSY